MVAVFALMSVLIVGVFLFVAFILMPGRIGSHSVRALAQGFFVSLALSRVNGIVRALNGSLELDAGTIAFSALVLATGIGFSIGMWREIVVKGHVRPWDD